MPEAAEWVSLLAVYPRCARKVCLPSGETDSVGGGSQTAVMPEAASSAALGAISMYQSRLELSQLNPCIWTPNMVNNKDKLNKGKDYRKKAQSVRAIHTHDSRS